MPVSLVPYGTIRFKIHQTVTSMFKQILLIWGGLTGYGVTQCAFWVLYGMVSNRQFKFTKSKDN